MHQNVWIYKKIEQILAILNHLMHQMKISSFNYINLDCEGIIYKGIITNVLT